MQAIGDNTGAPQVTLLVENLPANAGDVRDTSGTPGSERPPGGAHGIPPGILAWRIPWTEEPGGLQSMWLHRVVRN